MNWKTPAYLIIFFFISAQLFGQTDSLVVENEIIVKKEAIKVHSSKKAALYSLFPGGGQFYNKSYWKIPVIYAALFVTGSFVFKNNTEFQSYKEEAINRYNYGITVNYPELSDQEVLDNKDDYEYKRNLNVIIFFGVYLLNIVDATVDAQFFDFDVSPDVSLHVEPYIRNLEYNTGAPISTGITLSLKL